MLGTEGHTSAANVFNMALKTLGRSHLLPFLLSNLPFFPPHGRGGAAVLASVRLSSASAHVEQDSLPGSIR